MYLPRRHKDTKGHKEFIFSDLFLLQLCALVPWWQKNPFRSRLKLESECWWKRITRYGKLL